MPKISLILFAVSMCAIIPASAMIFIYKKDEVSYKDSFLQGSSVYRHMHKYVKEKHIRKIKILTYFGLASFLGFVGSLFFIR